MENEVKSDNIEYLSDYRKTETLSVPNQDDVILFNDSFKDERLPTPKAPTDSNLDEFIVVNTINFLKKSIVRFEANVIIYNTHYYNDEIREDRLQILAVSINDTNQPCSVFIDSRISSAELEEILNMSTITLTIEIDGKIDAENGSPTILIESKTYTPFIKIVKGLKKFDADIKGSYSNRAASIKIGSVFKIVRGSVGEEIPFFIRDTFEEVDSNSPLLRR